VSRGDKDEIRKGVPVGKGAYAVMTDEALEQIKSGVRTSVAQPAYFAPLSSLDLSLASTATPSAPTTRWRAASAA
jgi:hypothetical protein